MHKLIALYHRPEQPQKFKDHLLGVHLPLVAKFPGLKALRVGFDVAIPTAASTPDTEYFAVVECDFDDESALQRALASAEGQAASADVPNYAAAGVTILTFPIQLYDNHNP
ncbi:MAG: EthD family reductase [Proteobacteria bacterium]|nr:EthD family reductase [Pseudomonadota bacterium]